MAIGTAALLFLLYKIDMARLTEVLKSLNVVTILLFVTIPLINLLLSTLNAAILFWAVGIDIHYRELMRKILFSRAIGFYLPGKVGDFSLVYLLKDNVLPGVTASVLLIDKLITFIVLLSFSAYGLFIFFSFLAAVRILVVLAVILLAVCGLLFIRQMRKVVRKAIGKYSHHFTGFGRTADRLLHKHTMALALNFVFTVLLWSIIAFVFTLIFWRLGYSIGLIDAAAIHSTSMIISFVPVSISGVGIRESMATYLYSQLGVDSAVAAGVYLVSLFFSYLWATIVLLVERARA